MGRDSDRDGETRQDLEQACGKSGPATKSPFGIERLEPSLTAEVKDDRPEQGVVSSSSAISQHSFIIGSRNWAFFALLGLYILPGLVGHQPWKQDETYIVEIVRHMVESRDLVVPTMAGEAFMEKPPLFYWTAAFLASLLRPILPLHDAARLATGCFLFLACMAVSRCARGWRGEQAGRAVVLILLGCLGMETYAHLMLTDIALLAGVATGMAGLPHWRTRPVASGFEIGTGIGIGFLAKGLLAPGVFGLSMLLLPLCFSRWRVRAYMRALLVAALTALPWLTVWPVVLWHRSHGLFSDWFWMNNIGRFVGFSVSTLGAAHDPGFWLKNLGWLTFPAAPLAILSLCRQRRELCHDELTQAALVLVIVMLAVLCVSASARGGYVLPLLLPLSLLGASAGLALVPTVERIWTMFGRFFLGGIALLIWAVWAYVVFSHDPMALHRLYEQLPPHPDRHVHFTVITGCAVVSFVAGYLMFGLPVRQVALQTWAVGVTLCWLLLALLFMPWLDEVKSYRQVFRSVQPLIAAQRTCVASYGLGESERAMLDYYDGVVTQRLEQRQASDCALVLLGNPTGRLPDCSDRQTWQWLWEGTRPAERHERFWLFKRRPGAINCKDAASVSSHDSKRQLFV